MGLKTYSLLVHGLVPRYKQPAHGLSQTMSSLTIYGSLQGREIPSQRFLYTLQTTSLEKLLEKLYNNLESLWVTTIIWCKN